VNPQTLKFTITYDGTRLVGWQRQAHGMSVQGLLEEALAGLEGAPVTVHGAGRTDAGVHALGQVASAQLTCDHSPAVLLRALNASLPPDVRVVDVHQVEPAFHARFSARAKTYRYLLRNGSLVSPFEHRYVWQVQEPLDLDAMQIAAQTLVGTHDFAVFRSAGGHSTTTVRTIAQSEMSVLSSSALLLPPGDWGEGRKSGVEGQGLLGYEVSGSGFLRHMVRAIVGTLVDIGRGRHAPARMAALLESGSRSDAGPTAPAQGLFLVRVDYHESPAGPHCRATPQSEK
jgi:tRNA pseudouridine38-40 synthase